MPGAPKETPWCTIFLVAGALMAHTLVLTGNLSTARMLHRLGDSTDGWSKVGQSLGNAMARELDPGMMNVSDWFTETIDLVTKIQKSTDVALSAMGSTTDAALAQLNSTQRSLDDIRLFKAELVKALRALAEKLFRRIAPLLDRFIERLKPALDQIQEWLTTFGTRIQHALEDFSTTVDRVQKLFDQVMSQMNPGVGSNEEVMVYNTYTMFDTDKSGIVLADDLRSVSSIFGIPALAGDKADELLAKYDGDGKGGLDAEEYGLFVNDPDLPGIMAVTLRTYSRRLSEIGGRIATQKMRDELAVALVDYIALVSSKNMTRVYWVSQALTNRSLPIMFTADVLKEAAMIVDNPNALTLVDVGAVLVREMMRLDLDYVVTALRLLATPSFWASEGFDGKDQPVCIQRLAAWVEAYPNGADALRKGLGLREPRENETLSHVARRVIKKRQLHYSGAHSKGKAADDAALYTSTAAQALRDHLLGGAGAAAGGANPDAEQAVFRGQKALPATLQFAQWLAANASDKAKEYLQDCFEYSGQSSGTLESFASQVTAMISRTQSFMNHMYSFASPQGVDRLVNQSVEFARNAAEDVLLVSEGYVDEQVALLECQLSADLCNATVVPKDYSLDLTGAFPFLTTTLHDLKSVLPTVIQDLRFARKGVMSVSSSLRSVMQVLGGKAPSLFYQIAALYKSLWVAYFILFGLLSMGTLLYGFWAVGYFGGPQVPPPGQEVYEAPRTFGERLRTCCSACTACLKGCNDTQLCFWSILLLAEVLVLVLFIVAVAISIIGGLQAFLSAGCRQIYILGNDTICTTSLQMVRGFLKTFWAGYSFKEAASMNIDETCQRETLLTCAVISQQLTSGVKIAIIGGVLAATLSFQMIVESAVMHESTRWRRMLDAEAKRP